MPRTILYDGLRLFLGAAAPAPRGIDRVDLLYARFLFEHWRGDCLGILPTPWGVRLYSRPRALRLLDALESRWRESTEAANDPALHDVESRLAQRHAAPPDHAAGKPLGLRHAITRELALLSNTGIVPGRSAVRRAVEGAIYLNIGQLGWAARWTTGWLRHRPDVRAVFMLHDIIPLAHPDLVSPSGLRGHRRILDVVARHATGVITTTETATDTIRSYLSGNHKLHKMHSSHLPVAPIFLRSDQDLGRCAATEYFLVCGAIEPRKNHLMLLNVWHRLLRLRGARTPVLVIAGTPAYRGQELLRQLTEHSTLRPFVVVVSGLSSPALRRLISNAQAVLAPSLAEGFGLPVAEALAAGTPVLASDLPAHREVGRNHAVYIDPIDEAAWLDWLCRILDAPGLLDALRRAAATFQPMTTASYFAGVQAFLEEIP